MPTLNTEDLRIESIDDVITPAQVHEEFPISASAATLVDATRSQISAILNGKDDRLLVVVGPCSIHDPDAAREYASRLSVLRSELANELAVVMRNSRLVLVISVCACARTWPAPRHINVRGREMPHGEWCASPGAARAMSSCTQAH